MLPHPAVLRKAASSGTLRHDLMGMRRWLKLVSAARNDEYKHTLLGYLGFVIEKASETTAKLRDLCHAAGIAASD
jgi:hypothetical protein